MAHILYMNHKDKRMQRIVTTCPSLYDRYKPPWWCVGPWMNTFIMMMKELCSTSMPMQRDTIITSDGGEISIDWASDDVTNQLPESAPIIGILHPLTGNSWQQSGFMFYVALRGWRSCVLNRRGHSGMALRVIPHFSILGNVDDSVVMVNHIRKCYPNNFIALAGISAGSGQVVSYIGREGDDVRVDAAASLCPAWDLSESFYHLQQQHPFLDWYITRNVKHFFLAPPRNAGVLSSMSEAVDAAWKAGNLTAFMKAAAPLAGCKDLKQFFEENNPMVYAHGNKIPCLVLNALDDFLCVKENIQMDLKDKVENYILLITEEGSHIAYNEGFFANGNYMWRLTLDFFDAVKLDKFR